MPRITLEADKTFNSNLERLVETTSASSKAEVIRNAIAVYRYLKGALPQNNGIQQIEIVDQNGATKHLLIP